MRTRRTIAALAIALGVIVVPASAAGAKPANKATEECIKKLDNGGAIDDCQKAPSLIKPATNELVWGALSFIIVFVVLAKFAYPAIKKGMEDRSNKIRDSLDDADRTKNEAQGILDEY